MEIEIIQEAVRDLFNERRTLLVNTRLTTKRDSDVEMSFTVRIDELDTMLAKTLTTIEEAYSLRVAHLWRLYGDS